MNIALLAPSPVPLAIGGAENLWWGLLEHLNRNTEHHADLIKLPTAERDFWEIVNAYRIWSELDVSGYDVVISGKYPAWMAAHPRHVVYLLHPLRGLYDTYPGDWPTRCESTHPEVQALVAFIDRGGSDRALLAELFGRLDALRVRDDVPDETYALPAPLIRQVVQYLDAIGRAPQAIARSVALSATVAARPDYFPVGAQVPVAHAPTRLGGLHTGRDRYLFTVSRLDGPKRIDLLIRAMEHVKTKIPLRIAGTGPQEAYLRELAAGDSRIVFDGFLNDAGLADAYAGARAVLFAPAQEDYGYITVEAMLSGKPVITTTDSGGPTELIEDGVHGLIAEPEPAAIGAAIDRLAGNRRAARRMGRSGRTRALEISWDRVVATLLDGVTPSTT
jgi:glycosyltransferase involved in cell wall biosynthesis